MRQVQNILKKSAANSGLEIGPEKRTSQVWKSCCLRSSSLIFKVPRHSTKHAKWIPKWNHKLKNKKIQIIKLGDSRNTKNRLPISRQKCQHDVKIGSHKFRESVKMKPWVSRARKGIPKASKRHPKESQRCPESMKMTSKRRSQGIRIR